MAVEIKWEGDKELMEVFVRAHKHAARQAHNALHNNIEEMKATAVKLAPVDTGFLKENIYTEYAGFEDKVISGAGYSGFLEFGTRYMTRQPYMQPALDQQAPKFKKDIEDILKEAFK